MLHWRIIYYLLQFYLFTAGGALSYLSLRAFIDPSLSRGKRDDPNRVAQWTHGLRGMGLLAIAAAAMVGALREGASGIGVSVVALVRLGGYVLFLAALPRSLWREKIIWLGACLIAAGELLLIGHNPAIEVVGPTAHLKSYAALALSDIGLGVVGMRMVHAILRMRLVDRLVISFAVYGLLLSQMVAFLELELLSSFGVDMMDVESLAEKPLLMILTAVLILSALIGFFLARDLSSPVTRLGRALRAIGEGNLNQRVDVKRNHDDEMNDLAAEVNRMAARLTAADELRADFFSFVSHELRTPLTSIKGFISTLESIDDFSPSERAEMYAIVDSETDRLLRMINELLDLSRVQAGTPLSLNCKWFDLGTHLSKTAGMTGLDANRHRIDLDIPNTPVWMFADQDKVTQIVINLMSNAIKYSPNGGTVTIKLRYSDSSVTISVTDEGVGMTAEQTKHIFDKFYRVSEHGDAESSKRLRRVEGAGIGLYLTRALVEAHGGEIAVSSTPGRGSAFTVTLPKQAAQLEPATDPHENGDPGSREPFGRPNSADRERAPHLVRAHSDSKDSSPARQPAGKPD